MFVFYMIMVVLVLVSMISGRLMYQQRQKISNEKFPNNKMAVSLIIPARNEAQNLPNLLATITGIDNKEIEVIVMNDGSTDKTQEIAQGYGAKVYNIDNKSSWKGKSRACWEGSKHASHDLLLFIDADVQFCGSESIEKIVQQYQRQNGHGLLSIQPYHRIQKVYENISAIFNLMTIVGMNKFSITSNNKDKKNAFGPIMLTNKKDYHETQGHLNAKDKVIEGFALSKAYSDANMPVEIYEGEGIANFRMYPQGFKALVEGWSKHFALGSTTTKKSTFSLIILWLMGSVVSSLTVLLSVKLSIIYIMLSLLIYIAYTIQFHLLINRTGNFSLTASACHPFLFICFLAIFFKSWLDANIFKRIKWKDRDIKL